MAFARAGFDHPDAALARDEWRVDVVQRFIQEIAEQSFKDRRRDRLGVEVGGLAAQFDRDLAGSVLDNLRGESAKPFAKHQVGAQDFEFLGGQRGDIDRLADRAVKQEIADLLRDIDCDLNLRLTGGGAQMGRGDHLGQLEQRMVGRGRLFDKDVERGPGDLAGRIALTNAASSTIPPRAQLMIRTPSFIRAMAASPIRPARLLGQRGMDGDEVGAFDRV